MSEYFEQEAVLKGYDSSIMRRILSYLRPYLAVFLLSILALLLATGGEVLLPVLIQRATDEHILPQRQGVFLDRLPEELRDRLTREGPLPEMGGLALVPSSRMAELSAREKRDLREQGTLLEGNYYLVEGFREDPELAGVIGRHPELFLTGASAAAISAEDMRSLPREEIKSLRKGDYQGLFRIAQVFVAVLLGVFAFTFLQVYLEAYVGQMIMKDLRTQLFDHTLRLSLRFLDRNPVGRLVSRITNDVETINEMFTTVLSSTLKDLAMMVGVLVAIFLLSPRLGLVTLLTLPPVFVLTLVFRTRAREAFRKVRLAVSRLNSYLSEHISGMRVVQLFAQEKASKQAFEERNQELYKANLGEMFVFATFRPLVDLLSTVTVAVIIYFGAGMLLRDVVSLGVLIAFLNLVRMFYQPVMDLSEKYNILQSAMAGAERVFNLLDASDRIVEPERPVPLPRVQGRIEFDRVGFHYKEGEPVLRELSFTVNPGERVAIVGYTGAGKTTITSLLTRLWDVQSGAIRIDGTDIRQVARGELRRRVQSVLQEVFLFSGSILDNIRLGSPIPEERIREAVRLVRADSFVDKMPDGIHSPLTERGGNLSVGQRQLISFARVLAHDPDVLILDEATGNIDTETEKLIQEALERLLAGRTSLVIAHRLSTIRHADRILVLHQGQLYESGTHEELMRRKGMYHSLYRMQFLAAGGAGGGAGGGGA
ncbi:MAG: ABC transporter ATP-binding protein [Spirochaetales bacterium]|nr:ABC transporter ATP-binding protein [Spirochaetales bacterium]